MPESKFIDGFFVKPPHENAPDFVKCKISMKREEVIEWLQGQDGDWINVDIKRSREGKLYAQVDEWKPDGERQGGHQASDSMGEDIPFAASKI